MKIDIQNIPLKILICDSDIESTKILNQVLNNNEKVIDVTIVYSIKEAQGYLRSNDINTIFIDPLSVNLNTASKFIFGIRETLPEIVFVLYVDKAASEKNRTEFYLGKRRRFSHYYTLDKQTPFSVIKEELDAVLLKCQYDLSWRMSRESLNRLFEEAKRILNSKSKKIDQNFLKELQELIPKIYPMVISEKEETKMSVFLSHRFAESEYVQGITKLLEQNGFKVITGKSANAFISKAILERIRECEFFLCLMTKHKQKKDGTWSTSPWLLEEKGAAIALNKRIVLMVEEGVTEAEIGGLQGDWQRIHFGQKGFLNAALEAAYQLKSYTGVVD